MFFEIHLIRVNVTQLFIDLNYKVAKLVFWKMLVF